MKRWQWLLLGIGGLLVATCAWLYSPDKSRGELATYVRSPADFVAVAGMQLHVRDDGPRTAPAVLMLHGFGASLQTWEPWASALSNQFRVIRLDLPGFGLTGPDPTNDYSDARSVAVIVALLDKLGIPRASLIGNSLGGRIAWKFAAAHPARTERLVLVSPDGFASPGFEYGKAPEISAPLRLLPYVLPTFMVKMSMEPAYANPSFVTDPLVTRYRDMLLAPGVRKAMLARMEQSVLEPPEPILRTISAPTLLLWGEQDGMIPFGNSADYLRALPHATLVPLPGLGHLPQEEDPQRSLVPVRAFLAPLLQQPSGS
jgi:pimeloyl-ACP methyl ester carboxylesterase